MRFGFTMEAIATAVFWSGTGLPALSADMTINHQVILSPTHMVAPYSVSRAANGDLLIAGADDVANHRAWATRVGKTGVPIWEFLDGSADGWTDYSQNNQSFYSAIDLSDGNTLLCGIKRIDKKLVAFLVIVRLGSGGELIDERVLTPGHNGFPLGIRCSPWGNGVAVVSDVVALPRGTGWITKLDATGNILWEKFGDQYVYMDAMQTRDGGLYLIGGNGVYKLDADGNVLAQHDVNGGDLQFIHSIDASSLVRVGATLPSLKTDLTARPTSSAIRRTIIRRRSSMSPVAGVRINSVSDFASRD